MENEEKTGTMSEDQTKNDTPFWRFSLGFYRQSGVADACIGLQDDCGVDVNLLLFLLWLASDGRLLAADEVKRLDDMVRGWRNLTIVPVRDVRRRLKGARTMVDSATQEAYRNRIKAVELEAERLQQEALYASTKSGPLGAPADAASAARGNIAAYERVMGSSFPKSGVELLLAAFAAIVPARSAAAAAAGE
jgi:uncharacterized protein (TIGR02444 family)